MFDTISQVQVDQILIGDFRHFRHSLEVLDDINPKLECHLLLEAESLPISRDLWRGYCHSTRTSTISSWLAGLRTSGHQARSSAVLKRRACRSSQR